MSIPIDLDLEDSSLPYGVALVPLAGVCVISSCVTCSGLYLRVKRAVVKALIDDYDRHQNHRMEEGRYTTDREKLEKRYLYLQRLLALVPDKKMLYSGACAIGSASLSAYCLTQLLT